MKDREARERDLPGTGCESRGKYAEAENGAEERGGRAIVRGSSEIARTGEDEQLH